MDVSGNNRYATMLGFESNQSIWEAGKIGNAIRFDGVNDYATVPATLGSNFTVCLWIKTTSNDENATSTNWNGPIGLVTGPLDKHALMLATANSDFGGALQIGVEFLLSVMSIMDHGYTLLRLEKICCIPMGICEFI